MDTTKPDSIEAQVEYWKNLYQKQKLLIRTITSLLNKYGSSLDLDNLHSAFLLTLMGHYVISDACYYAVSDSGDLAPAVAYGCMGIDDLPVIPAEHKCLDHLRRDRMPTLISTLSRGSHERMDELSGNYTVVAPLHLKDRLTGLLFLSDKVSGEAYRDFDFEVLYALCAVSATTFNNAKLYRNAKMSAQEIKRLYDVRSEVISRITHEFRTPLTVIKAAMVALADSADSSPWHEPVVGSVERLEGLIGALLELNDEEDTEGDPDMQYDPVATVHDAVLSHSDRARRKRIHFVVNQKTTMEGIALNTPKASFTTALNAIIDNAVKFSRPDTSVLVIIETSEEGPTPERDGVQFSNWEEHTQELMDEYTMSDNSRNTADRLGPEQMTARIKHLRRQALGFLIIRVADNGIGIPEADIAAVAEPFRQASNSPNLGVKGRGLGLALVQKIATHNGGYVCCKTEENIGTTFSLYLPLC